MCKNAHLNSLWESFLQHSIKIIGVTYFYLQHKYDVTEREVWVSTFLGAAVCPVEQQSHRVKTG